MRNRYLTLPSPFVVVNLSCVAFRAHNIGTFRPPTHRSPQSTLGAELARVLNVPLISLDRLFWGPGWYKTPEEEFRAQVRKALNQSDRGWVIDGKYAKRLGSMIETEATDTICECIPFLAH